MPTLKNRRLSAGGREALWAAAFLAPSLTGTLIFSLLPFLGTAASSFLDAQGSFVFLHWYGDVLNNGAFLLAAKNTARFLAICVPLLLVMSLALAQGLQYVGSQPLRGAYLLPMVIPVSSAAFLWQLLFDANGILNGTLAAFGMEPQSWLQSGTAFWVLAASYLWRNAGFTMVLLLAALNNIPASVYEAARVDGAGTLRIWRSITLPLIKPSLLVTAVLSLINGFKVFREAYLISGSYPHESIYMLQHLFNNWFTRMEAERMSAAAMLTAFALAVLIALLNRLWKEAV